jgi:hypothetical protein
MRGKPGTGPYSRLKRDARRNGAAATKRTGNPPTVKLAHGKDLDDIVNDKLLDTFARLLDENPIKALAYVKQAPPLYQGPMYLGLSLSFASLAEEKDSPNVAEFYRQYAKHFEYLSGYSPKSKEKP